MDAEPGCGMHGCGMPNMGCSTWDAVHRMLNMEFRTLDAERGCRSRMPNADAKRGCQTQIPTTKSTKFEIRRLFMIIQAHIRIRVAPSCDKISHGLPKFSAFYWLPHVTCFKQVVCKNLHVQWAKDTGIPVTHTSTHSGKHPLKHARTHSRNH